MTTNFVGARRDTANLALRRRRLVGVFLASLPVTQGSCATFAQVAQNIAAPTCPVRVTLFQVLVQPARPNGSLWDDVAGAVSTACGMIEDPGALVRGVLDIDAGGEANQAIDSAIGRALQAYTSQIAAGCKIANTLIDIVNFLKGPSAPDVYLTYGTLIGSSLVYSQEQISPVYENATFNDLQHLTGLLPLTIGCNDLDSTIMITAIDRDSDVLESVLTLGMANSSHDELVGNLATSLSVIGPDAIRRGFTYVTPNPPNGLIAVGLRFDVVKEPM